MRSELFEQLEDIPLDYPNPELKEDDLVSLGKDSDGSITFLLDKGREEEEEKAEEDFYRNLAEDMESAVLENLCIRLIDEINEDLDARKEWESNVNIIMKYLGFKIEESRNVPFMRACAAYDSTLAKALISNYATLRAELFPPEGPAESEILGIPTKKTEDEAERVKIFLNYYLTDRDKDYYPDSETLLLYMILFGSAFRKIYQDPILEMPVARTIKPQDLIVNPNTNSLLTSNRITQVIYLDRKDIVLREMSGDFIKYDLPAVSEETEDKSKVTKTIKQIEGIDTNSTENKNLFKYYEVHVDLFDEDLKISSKDDKNLPKPYVVTINVSTKKIASIKRNWNEKDSKFTRKQYFVNWYFLPGFGIYGTGLANLLGSNAVALTDIERQLIDAGTLKNFPGGLKTKHSKSENNNVAIGPCEFLEIDTGGYPISENVMLMPYGEPSQVLASLREELKKDASELAATAEMGIPEIGTNTPVGTALASIEKSSKVQSTILRSCHVSLGNELKLLYNLFGEYLEDEPYPFKVPGGESFIMRKDFNDSINIIPVSNPNILTSTHRIMLAQSLMSLANTASDLYDMREIHKNMLKAMNVEDIDKVLKPENVDASLDAISENMYVMANKGIVVAPYQDHKSHLPLHLKFGMEVQSLNPVAYVSIMEHSQVHKSYIALENMSQEVQQAQQQIQMNPDPNMIMQIQNRMNQIGEWYKLPPNELIKVPEVQNMISSMDAKEEQERQEMMKKAQEEQPKPIDPNAVMMAEIEQRREAAQLNYEAIKLKVEAETFKAQLKFEGEKLKIESQRDINSEKNEANREIAELKQVKQPINTHHEVKQ
jgi:hypothetical protein